MCFAFSKGTFIGGSVRLVFLGIWALLATSALGESTPLSLITHALTNALRAHPSAPDADPGVYKLVAQVQSATGNVEYTDCSGFVVEGCYISAGHCLDRNFKSISIQDGNGNTASVDATTKRIFRRADLGVGADEKSVPDLAVVKLGSIPPGAYDTEILSDKMPTIEMPKDVLPKSPAELLEKAGALIKHGVYARTTTYGMFLSEEDVQSMPNLKPEEGLALIKRRREEQVSKATKQDGQIVVVGPVASVFSRELTEEHDLQAKIEKKILQLRSVPVPNPIELSEWEDMLVKSRIRKEKLLSMTQEWMAFPAPTILNGGDSGGPAKDKDGKFFALVSSTYGNPPDYFGLQPLVPHREWILRQLKDLGCATPQQSALEAMP